MKRLLFVLLACGLIACEKEDDPFSMDISQLPGTYWEEIELYYLGDGCDNDNVFDTNSVRDGGRAPSILLFGSNAALIEYCNLGVTGHSDRVHYYRKETYFYDPETKVFTADLHTLAGWKSTVTAWTWNRLEVVGYDQQGAPYCRQVFERFDPDQAWLQRVAAWPDYDEIDWNPVPPNLPK